MINILVMNVKVDIIKIVINSVVNVWKVVLNVLKNLHVMNVKNMITIKEFPNVKNAQKDVKLVLMAENAKIVSKDILQKMTNVIHVKIIVWNVMMMKIAINVLLVIIYKIQIVINVI